MIRNLFKIAIVSTTLALSGCGTQVEWNQKLTVKVSTLDDVKSGSSVVGYSATVGKQFASGSGISRGLQGEATVVEVAPGKYLFALLEGAQEIAVRTFYDRLPKNDALAMQQAVSELREERDVPQDRYPMLVTFSKINDPKTVREVKPDQFSSIFGPGYSLKSITVEITDEPVTEGKVESVLRWVSEMNGSIGKGMNLPYDHLLNQINDGSFHQGATK
jgi:hypothetical protein